MPAYLFKYEIKSGAQRSTTLIKDTQKLAEAFFKWRYGHKVISITEQSYEQDQCVQANSVSVQEEFRRNVEAELERQLNVLEVYVDHNAGMVLYRDQLDEGYFMKTFKVWSASGEVLRVKMPTVPVAVFKETENVDI